MAHEPDGPGARARRSNAPAARDFIAENLQALFRKAESEPLPEALQALLDRLSREEAESLAKEGDR